MRKRFMFSPDEVPLTWMLEDAGFSPVEVIPFDFLSSSIPAVMVGVFESLGGVLERVLWVKEVADSRLVRREQESTSPVRAGSGPAYGWTLPQGGGGAGGTYARRTLLAKSETSAFPVAWMRSCCASIGKVR